MRNVIRELSGLVLSAMVICVNQPIHAQNDAQNTAIQQKLKSTMVLTKVTADRSDIVTPGAVVVLHKDGLLMYAISSPMPPMNTYKNGKVSQGWSGFGRDLGINMRSSGGATVDSYPKRTFVEGEKLWITNCSVANDGVLIQLYSDPYDNVRYYGQLKIPFSKGVTPPIDNVVRTVSEVLTEDNVAQDAQPSAPAPAPAPARVTPAMSNSFMPVAPPPPPTDAIATPTKTVSLGLSKAQVAVILGEPLKIANLGEKEIDYYSDMKVIFVRGKVTDIQ